MRKKLNIHQLNSFCTTARQLWITVFDTILFNGIVQSV